MYTYSLTSKLFTGEILFKYDLSTDLVYFENKAQMSDEQKKYLLEHMPLTLTHLKKMALKDTITINEIPEDLTFERFYNKYNYKVGSKKRAESIWKGLSNTDKYLCLQAIDRYNSFLNKKKNMERAYPETFLNQRRWENNFNV